ncbi:glycosyltransferase [Lactobacillus rodentium]|uniref:Glycosyl transferase n=1 Tax=Lactobacillus rodentium TaxID=947835 RepID=A0A2Z6TPX4_9LACO|nr:glycosyltransferase [Lactobacillus rodentium]MCR1894463.1 glycosyltransferase [Lactobacillus rodentium]GBG04827.1 glycosyl transferase [Lactobacillus rodentium]
MVEIKRKQNILIGILFLVPLILQLFKPLMGTTGSFILEAILSIILLVVLFFNNITELDQWFLERAVSCLGLSLGILNIFKYFNWYPLENSTFVFTLGITCYALSLYFLNKHFTLKNILLILLDLNILANYMEPAGDLLILFISIFTIILYLIQVLITHTQQLRLPLLIVYIITFLVGLIWFTPQFIEFDPNEFAWQFEAIGIILIMPLSWLLVINKEAFSVNSHLIIASLAYIFIAESTIIIVEPRTFNIALLVIFFLMYLSLVNFLGNIKLSTKNKKISVLIPTYNGAATIVETLESVKRQTYQDWEVIIIDDGSTDNTESVINRYLKYNDLPVRYIRENNQDQLNAVKHGMNYITGDICYILHSDDVLYDNNVFYRATAALMGEKCDGIFIGIQEIDGQSRPKKVIHTKAYYDSQTVIAKTALGLGRNPYVDFTYWRKEVFEKIVKVNYLTNNLPAWYNAKTNSGLKVINANFIGLKYRVFEGNYLNSSDGSVNVLSGELRTLHHILGHLKIPVFKFQSLYYRAMNKFYLSSICPVLFKQGKTNLKTITPNVVSRRVKTLDNPYLKSIVDFSQNYTVSKKAEIKVPLGVKIYTGADIREFNRNLKENSLEKFYWKLMDIISSGVATMVVTKEDKDKLEDILEFFTIKDYVKIEVK